MSSFSSICTLWQLFIIRLCYRGCYWTLETVQEFNGIFSREKGCFEFSYYHGLTHNHLLSMIKKQKRETQRLLNLSLELDAELKAIEDQLEDLETKHLEKTWKDGNIVVGWHYSQREPESSAKFEIVPKDKIFSLSSLTSRASRQIEQSAFKNINGPTEGRFASNRKKYKRKKKKSRLQRLE